MAKTYARIYSTTFQSAFADPPKHTSPSVTIPAAQFAVLKIMVTSEGSLDYLSVQQVGGTPVSFNVDLLNSGVPYPAGFNPNALAATPVCPLSAQRVIPQQLHAGADGLPMEVFAEFGKGYSNVDGTVVGIQPYLYVVIYPQGAAGITVWDVSLRTRSGAAGG